MSKNVWIATIDTPEEVLSTKIYFETREQADRFVNLIQSNPEILFPGIKLDNCIANNMICTVNPIPVQDNKFIDDYEKSIEVDSK